MKNIILFAAVGRSDLQIVYQEGDNLIRDELRFPLNLQECQNFPQQRFNYLRDFHQWLLDNPDKYCIYTKRDTEKSVERGSTNTRIVYCENGKLLLVPAKLARVVELLKEGTLLDEGVIEKYRVKGSVVFSTQREKRDLREERSPKKEKSLDKIYRDEPIAAGKILSGWLATEFGLTHNLESEPGIGNSTWINILDKGMLSPDDNSDYPVNREAIRRVDKVISDFAKQDFYACVSVGGGLPETKEPIKSCARYRFNQRVMIWQDPEFLAGDWEPEEERRVLSVTESFQLRQHATVLVRSGDFPGAYAAVRHLENIKGELTVRLNLSQVYEIAVTYGFIGGSHGIPHQRSKNRTGR